MTSHACSRYEDKEIHTVCWQKLMKREGILEKEKKKEREIKRMAGT
jgi:hypothetical protein